MARQLRIQRASALDHLVTTSGDGCGDSVDHGESGGVSSARGRKPGKDAYPGRLVAHRAVDLAIPLAVALLLLATSATNAASALWTGATDSNWSSVGNWTASPPPGSGDTATFGFANNGNTTISLGTGVTIQTLQFHSAGSSSYTIGVGAVGSETLTFNHGSFVAISESSNTANHLINAAVVLGTNANTATYQVWTDANRTLTFAGPITGGTGGIAGTKTLSIGLNGDSGNVIFNGVIGGGSGTIAIEKVGTLTLTLNGNNTFTGPLTFVGGNITVPVINNSNADGPLGHSTVAVEFAIENAFGGGVLKYTGGTATSSKRFTMTSGGTFNIDSATADLTLTGLIDGTGGGLGKSGPGTLTITAVNTYGPYTTINGGTLRLSGSGRLGATTNTLVINNAGKLDLGGTDQTVGGILTISGFGTIVNNGGGASLLTVNVPTGDSAGFTGSILDNDNATAGTVALTKTGAGALGLGSIFATSNYSGATLVTNGALQVQSASALGSDITGTTVSSGATLQIFATNIASEPVTISGVGETGFTGALEGYNATYGGLLKLNAASTVATSFAGGTFDITNPGIIIGATFTLTLAGEGTGSIASIIGTTSGGLVKNDTGKWTLTGANTYTNTTTINAGILNIQNANALGASTSNDTTIISGATLQIEGGITTPAAEGVTIRGVGAAGTTGALQNVSGNNTWSGTVTLGTNSTISSDADTLSLTSATAINDLFDLTITGAGDGFISTAITTGANTVTKTGTGAWTLTGANSFTGALTVANGTLSVPTVNNSTVNGPLGRNAGAVILGSTDGNTGTLSYTGATGSSTRLFTMATGGTGAFEIVSGGANFTLTGVIGGSGGLRKTGPGTLTLAVANTYTGDTSVSAGTLVVTNAFLANAADVSLASGATLNLTFAGSDTIDQLRIDGVIQSPGTWGSLSSSATYKTALITGTGILNVGSGAAQPPYASWAATYPLSGANYPFDADPDHDALDNGLEWILSGNPLANNASVLPQASSDATNLYLTFTRNDASESTSTLFAQWGTDLSGWTDVTIGATTSGPNPNGIVITVTEGGGAPDAIVVSFPRSLGGTGGLFVRLKATIP